MRGVIKQNVGLHSYGNSRSSPSNICTIFELSVTYYSLRYEPDETGRDTDEWANGRI